MAGMSVALEILPNRNERNDLGENWSTDKSIEEMDARAHRRDAQNCRS